MRSWIDGESTASGTKSTSPGGSLGRPHVKGQGIRWTRRKAESSIRPGGGRSFAPKKKSAGLSGEPRSRHLGRASRAPSHMPECRAVAALGRGVREGKMVGSGRLILPRNTLRRAQSVPIHSLTPSICSYTATECFSCNAKCVDRGRESSGTAVDFFRFRHSGFSLELPPS